MPPFSNNSIVQSMSKLEKIEPCKKKKIDLIEGTNWDSHLE